MIDAFEAEYEEAMLNLEAESTPRTRRRRGFIRRDRLGAHDRLYDDYFADNCTYPPSFFRRRYRMRRHLFYALWIDWVNTLRISPKELMLSTVKVFPPYKSFAVDQMSRILSVS